MNELPDWLLVHTVLIEPAEGEGPFGAEYGEQITVRCFIDDKRRMVRAATGAETVSETTLFMPLDTNCPTGSRVTVNDRLTTVLASSRMDGGNLPVPHHLEVALE